MHKDRNNHSWSELKAKKTHDNSDESPLKASSFDYGSAADLSYDSRKEKNDKATKQLDRVKNMFIEMSDYDSKRNNRS